MLRKRATRRSTGKQKSAQSANTRRAVATTNTLPLGRYEAPSVTTVEERLNSVAKEALRNMGED